MTPPDDDDALKQALRRLPPAGDPARLAALQQRVLAQWQARHAPAAAPLAEARGSMQWLVLAGPGRRRWWFGSGLLLGGAAMALGLWLRQPDPALEELLQPDVLSQMAAGEM
jgi:ferric-dicitrate binding protein FerR (iron transport regulator)